MFVNHMPACEPMGLLASSLHSLFPRGSSMTHFAATLVLMKRPSDMEGPDYTICIIFGNITMSKFMWWHLVRERLKWHLWRHLSHYVDFKTEPSKEETEFAKWEGYKALVLKIRWQVATHANFDGAEDMSSDGDAQPNEIDSREEHGGTHAFS